MFRDSELGPKHVADGDPEPVVPPDLHLIKPAQVDADGNFECIRCREKVSFAAADLVGSDGFVCPGCRRVAAAQRVVEPEDLRVHSLMWRWLVVVATIGALATGVKLFL